MCSNIVLHTEVKMSQESDQQRFWGWLNRTVKLTVFLVLCGGCRGCDRMVVGYITTYVMSAYQH
jgi:hypothetical protein